MVAHSYLEEKVLADINISHFLRIGELLDDGSYKLYTVSSRLMNDTGYPSSWTLKNVDDKWEFVYEGGADFNPGCTPALVFVDDQGERSLCAQV